MKCFSINKGTLQKEIVETGVLEVKISLVDNDDDTFSVVASIGEKECILHIGLGGRSTRKAKGQYHKYISWAEQIFNSIRFTTNNPIN